MTDDAPQDATCPVCDTEITAINKRGPATYALQPCGHEIDDQIYEDLVDE